LAVAVLGLSLTACATVTGKPVQTTPVPTPGDQSPAAAPTTIEPAAPSAERPESDDANLAVETDADLPDADEDAQQAEEVEPSPLDELPENPEVPAGELQREKDLVAKGFPGFDIPMILNDRVVAYVDYFTTRHKELFGLSLDRSTQYVAAFQR